MPYNVQLPNGVLIEGIPDDVSKDEARRRILKQFPDLEPEPTFVERAKTAFKRGVEQLPESLAGITLGAETGLGMTEAAGKKLREIKEEQAKAPAGAPGISFEDLEKIYGKDGAIAALQKLPAYITEQILQSAPSMAVPLAAGAAATPFGGPIVGGLAGIGAYGLQQYGQFMQTQAQGAKTIEDLEPGKAALAAAITAPLGFFVDRLTLGMSRVPTKALGEGIMAELAKRAGATVAGRAATGAAIGVIAEAPTEMLEQMAERWQANLPLFDDAAIREYKEAAAGAAAVGGVGGAASRVLMGRPEEVQPPAAEVPLRAPQAPTPPEIPQITPEVSTLTPPEVVQVPPEVSQVTPLGAPLGGEIREIPGFAGPAGANQQMMEIARQRQAQAEAAAAKENAKRQKQIQAIEAQTFSSDPLADRMAKDRMIASLPQPLAQPPAQPLAVAAQPQAQPLAQPLAQPVAEPPPFIPISEPQKRPRGVAAPEFTLGEEEEIKSLRQGLQQVNAQIAEAKKQDAGSLFTALKGKLRPIKGGIKLTDIDQDKASLKQLYSKQEGGGRPLEDLVSDGALDDFLPFNNRSTSPGFDDIAAAETIMERLRTGEYKTEAYLEKMRALEEQKGNIKDELDRRLRTPEINKELAGLAGRMRQPAEVVGLEDLMEDARLLGIDVENIKENVFYRMPDATPEQYRGELTTALQGAISDSRLNRIDDILPQMNAPATPVNKQGAAMQKQLEGKTVNQAIDWLIKNAPNRFQALVAEKVKAMVNALQQRGVEMTFEVQGGDRRNVILFGANGVTQYTFTPDKTSVVVRLNGEPVVANQRGYPSGMQYDTAQHEFLHVATRTATRFLPPDHPVIKELNDLYRTVIAQYNKDARAGKLPPVLQKFYERGNNVLESMDELLTWGITDEEFQNYLDNINVGPKQTAFNKLVSLIREILGLAKPFETALERLIRTTDSILTMDVQQISDAMQVRGYSFGSPKVAKAIGEQQSLFARKGQKLLRDDLAVRKEGFYFNAKNSPLYQTRTAEEVGDFSQQEADKIVALEGRAKKIQDERRWVGKLKDGAWVGTRLDLAVFRVAKKAGLPPVLAVHEGSESKHTKGGFSKGELLRLVPHITLSNVRFNVMQGERERIAEGGEKGRMASADGQYMDVPPNFDGIEVSFNPTREHLFRDALGRAIKYADEVTVLKNRMYARGNIEYYGAEDVPPVPTQPSDSWIMGSGQDARQLQQRPAIVDEGDKVSKDQQKNLFDGQDVIQDSLFSRREGFFIDAKQSPLYQKRSAADVPVITQELANRALATHAKGARVEGKGIELKPGDYIGARLDLPIRASSREVMVGGVPLQAIHMGNPTNYAREDGGFWDGKIAKYLPSVTMKNVKFRVDQTRREETAAGLKKRPMGSADGQFVRSDNPNFDGIELRFNPKREHLFVDAMGRSVKYADEVTVMGDRMYARGHVEYFGDEDFIQPAGVSPTQARVMSEEEAVRQAGPAVQQAVMESARTGKPLAAPIQDTLFKQAAAPVRTQTGEDAMEILSGIGRSVEPPEPGYVAKVRESWKNARDNPQATKEQALGSFRRWADQVETWAFSSDAALNNQIRRAIMESSLGNEEKIGTLLNASLSQTVHSDAIANLFLMEGNIRWDEEIHKWTGVKSENNIIKLSKQLDELAEKHGLTKEEAELIAHTAFEARRTASLIRENEQIEAQVEAIRAEAARIRAKSPVAASELSDKAAKLLTRKKIIHMTPEQINAGLTQFKLFPNLYQVADTWNGIRENALNVMVNTGLYSPQEADDLLSNADYVPFFREDQIEEGKGPKEFLRSLSVQADKRMKGSMKPVNDIFDNMVRWTQYAVNRGVRNRSALALVDTAAGLQLADRVKSAKDGDNVVRVWRNGKEEFYDMADPMFVSAFRGLESVAIPTIKVFSKVADVLRQSVVLYPGFALAQIPQDSFAAMFTSGLKPQYALRIPVLAAKEFLQTLRGKSKIHEELKNVGAAGVRDFTSAVIRNDAEVLAGLKKDKSFWAGVKRSLGNWAMAADNAVRQATYEAAMQQGLSKAEALEKAFEIFNVRRRGNSKMLAMAGQVIPFFNAYLAAQNVAYRTLTGVGTSPTQREAALKTLAATTGSVMVLSLIYAMMNGDDEDYLKKPTPTRDRLLMIPGTGISLPLRADLFILPKVLAEHTYMMVTDKGFSDSAKFRESMKSLLANAIFSPTPVPQAVKPITEAILNYDFFQQKPLVGVFQQRKELSRQFEDSTSEFARLLGKTEMISPIVADHLIRGMFGSFGGLVLYMTNPAIAAMSGRTRPDISMRDAIATIPNASAFVTKEYDVGLRKDFYALKEVTDRAAATMADLKNRSPQEIKEYLEDPVVKQRLGMAPVINRISNQLTQIRKQVNLVTNIEDPKFTDERKEEMIKKLRDQEYELLKNINLKKLREMAQV